MTTTTTTELAGLLGRLDRILDRLRALALPADATDSQADEFVRAVFRPRDHDGQTP